MRNLVVAIIPMRGGSKRVRGKNTRKLAGKPLAAYAIEAAGKSRGVDVVAVATDDRKIAEISRRAGADEVVMLPARLTKDASPSDASVVYALKELRARIPSIETVVYLQATSPFRSPKQIDEALQKFFKGGYDSLLSVCEDRHFYWLEQGGAMQPLYDYAKRPRSQDVEPKYRENGAIYVTRAETFLRTGNRLGGKIGMYLMDELSAFEIDYLQDFEAAEVLAKALAKKT